MMVARAAQADIDDGAGFLKRRRQRIAAAGIVAIGPIEIHSTPHRPDGSARIRSQRAQNAADQEHRETVESELRAIDNHERWLRKELGAERPVVIGPGRGRARFRDQELAAELRQVADLRATIEADRDRPITANREGVPLSERDRAVRRARARELAENLWAGAGRSAAAGDHREARRQRVDALRARLVAEYEMHWRTSLPGYSSPWN